jgi:PadR family transcriptional regulator PadR
LKNADILDYRWEESLLGPPRKYYEMTEKGNDLLNELEQSWEELNSVIEKLKNK